MIITNKHLGKKGRFANQLFQYARLRLKAKLDECEYQCPPWIGQKLFGLNDPPVTKDAHHIGFKFPLEAGYYAYDREFFRSHFRPVPEFDLNTVRELQAKGRTVIGLHLRRGDYGTFRRASARWCFVAPTEWYKDWLAANLSRFPNPILYLASDEPEKVVPDFADYDVVYPGPDVPDAPFWRDFHALTQCDVLLISNSTFGYAASMLNTRATEFYRPRLGEQRLIPYQPWSDRLILQDEHY